MFIEYEEAKSLFEKVIFEYESIIKQFSYQKFSLCAYENVYLIEDAFIIYVGLVKRNLTSIYYAALFEEFSSNIVFKFNVSGFSRKFNFGFIKYKKFKGIIGEPIEFTTKYNPSKNLFEIDKILIESKLNYVNSQLPTLKIIERYNGWEGILYNFIIFETSRYGEKGYAICYTQKSEINKIALKKCKEIQKISLASYIDVPVKLYDLGDYYIDNGIYISKNMVDIIKSNEFDIKKSNLKYFTIAEYIKNEKDIHKIQMKILKNIFYNNYKNILKFDYVESESKWKSEQLVYELTKKIFCNKTVIHQHRPYFLKTEKGQLSYDIFVCGENIAIEYQGKQHFQPIEIFGGEEAFKKQIERDKLKKYLSDKNDVNLIYINYWEEITLDLIQNKIKSSLKQNKD